MRALPPTSSIFAKDQNYRFSVELWDTPYTALDNDLASGGIVLDVVCPRADDSFTALAVVSAAPNTDITPALKASGNVVVENGRTDNLVGFWSGGAPAEHGATHNGRVAYHFHGELRSVAGRSWFSTAPIPTWYLAVAGQGYIRIDKTVSGVRTTIFSQRVTEQDFIDAGLYITPVINDMAAGDALDIYYVQDSAIDAWGGYVIKAVSGTPSVLAGYSGGLNNNTNRLRNQVAAKAAPVLGCGLLDDGDTAKQVAVTLSGVDSLEVTHRLQSAASARFTLPVANSAVFDGVGWEHVKAGKDDPGELRWWHGGVTYEHALKRQRLVRVKMGFENEPLYTVFTGLIHDFDKVGDGTAEVQCLGLDAILLEQFDQNFPDKISYMASGFRKLTGTTEPAYDTPAFDNWPMQYALRELLQRNGIDASNLVRPLTVAQSDGTTVPVVIQGEAFQKFRATSFTGAQLKLERSAHYGNNGVVPNEQKPADDPYIYKPENSREIWKRALDITDKFGYDLRFDEDAHCVLQPRNNPHAVFDFDLADVTVADSAKRAIHPSAFGGTYLDITGPFAVTKTVTGSRIDVCQPLGSTTVNPIRVTVYAASDLATPLITPITLDPHADADAFFYDFVSTVEGTNGTVATVFSGDFGDYVVTIEGDLAGAYRLDAILAYHTDPDTPRLPVALSTDENALSVSAQGGMDEMRNFVTVVGRKKLVGTDDEKALATNNPQAPFVVSRAVNVGSIVDPDDPTFIGRKRQSVIYNTDITDDDFANYLARTFIYRQRVPAPLVPMEHTLLPIVQLRDPVRANDSRFKTVTAQQVVRLTSITHRIREGKATTSLESTGYPEFPAFEPREDINIDLPEFGGRPVMNIDVRYTSLSGHEKRNLASDNVVHLHSEEEVVSFNVGIDRTGPVPRLDFDLGTTAPPWPPVDGSVFLKPASGLATGETATVLSKGQERFSAGASGMPIGVPGCLAIQKVEVGNLTPVGKVFVASYTVTTKPKDNDARFYYVYDSDQQTVTVRQSPDVNFWLTNHKYVTRVTYTKGQTGAESGWITNNPNHHYLDVDFRDAVDGGRHVYLPWKQGDTAASHAAWYQLSPLVDSMDIRYRSLLPFTRSSDGFTYTTYDPYNGESPFFDPYTSELGHIVNISFDALISGLYRVSIRHVDTGDVVAWLTESSADPSKPEAHWSYLGAGVGKTYQWDGVDNVGTHNRKQSEPYTTASMGEFEQDKPQVIGKGFYAWNQERKAGRPGPLALISAERDPVTGEPVFGVGTYGAFYVCIEAQNDTLQQIAEDDRTRPVPRVFTTRDTTPAAYTTGTSAIIYTHLPRPTVPELEIADWQGLVPFDADDADLINDPLNWGAPDADATLSNSKPIRVRFSVPKRPGVLWNGHEAETQLKLTRQCHVRFTIHDQSIVWAGNMFAGSSVPDRTIVTRKVTNDSHTFAFADTGYRRADSLKTADHDGTEWIFQPEQLKKNWRGVEDEPLLFGETRQFEDVPKWNTTRQLLSEHSRSLINFISYLFYLSAFATDRSGRSAWAVNPKFLDKSKIIHNDYAHWWKPDAPTVAADAATYRMRPVADPMTQHRRTIITRQWTDEDGWQARETARFALAGTVGEKLLKHYWFEHDPSWTKALADGRGLTHWSDYSLNRDEYTTREKAGKWMGQREVAGMSMFAYPEEALLRQLGQHGTGATKLGAWTWETAPLWVPCITRDWFGYFLVPPMMYPYHSGDGGYWRNAQYLIGDNRKYDGQNNSGADAAAGETWHSSLFDQTEPVGGDVIFHVGTKCQQGQDPFKTLAPHNVNYSRQDESVHWEELRGIISTGPRPPEAPRKIVPTTPYYINQWDYGFKITIDPARNNAAYPKYSADPFSTFALKFRSEYLWESGTMFPVNTNGVELLPAMNIEKHRIDVESLLPRVRFDDGGWTGWKDDGGSVEGFMGVPTIEVNYHDPVKNTNTAMSPFTTGYPAVALGPRMAETRDVLFHMALLNDRRDTPILEGV